MDRRELLKSGLLVAGAAAVGLTGCSKSNQEVVDSEISTKMPKQKEKFNITTPLPFNHDLIDEMADMNNIYKKSKITTLYNNIPKPLNSDFNDFFTVSRGYNDKIKTYDDFAKYFGHARDKGFEIVYVLNSPKSFSKEDYESRRDKLYSQLDFLHDIGCNHLRIGNTQLLSIIAKYKHKFNVSASTTFEFHNTRQYINLFKNYPFITGIDISSDENRNFPFLKNLHKLFPNVTLEVLVNEPCIMGCPARMSHTMSDIYIFECGKIRDNVLDMCRTANIYPWNLSYYQNVGVNSFKISSWPLRANFNSLYFLRNYMDCIEGDIEKSEMSFQFFVNMLFLRYSRYSEDVKVRDILKYLPGIRRFIKNGDKCATRCGVECTYCDECADKIKKIIGEK